MVLMAYLVGSISSAILLCKLLHLPDPRSAGSKNPGATNVLRISNKFVAASVLIFDRPLVSRCDCSRRLFRPHVPDIF
jgi:glycerol-3-phosphate acyltransferase PlsY